MIGVVVSQNMIQLLEHFLSSTVLQEEHPENVSNLTSFHHFSYDNTPFNKGQ